MEFDLMRSALRSDRSPIELPGFARTYQRMRILVNLLIPPAGIVMAGRLGGRREVVIPTLIVVSVWVLSHAALFPRTSLATKVTVDTISYIAMATVLGLPEVILLVSITQSFLIFLHVPPRTAARLLSLYLSTGVICAASTALTRVPVRTGNGAAFVLIVIAVFTAVPAAWMLSQSAAEILRQRTQREALSLEKDRLLTDKDRFVASVSHELRTPLTAVVGLAHTLAESPDLTTEERNEFVTTIVEQSEEVAAIVDDLLVAARASSGHLSLLVSEVTLRDELAMVAPPGIPVEESVERLTTIGDPIRVRQILRNLLSNAQRYGGPDKRVFIRTDGAMAAVEIQDNGRAIPDEQIEEIFSAYGRVHDRPGRTDSVGLGLTISRQLARLMGGDVTYSHDGTWASFRLTLPRSVADTARAISGSPKQASAAHRIETR
jgi:signal transduction histidine kinase